MLRPVGHIAPFEDGGSGEPEGKIKVDIKDVPCSPNEAPLTINGNPLQATKSGGISIKLDAPAALLVSTYAAQAANRNVTVAPNSVIALNPLPSKGYQLFE
jgi:hypothetical protein